MIKDLVVAVALGEEREAAIHEFATKLQAMTFNGSRSRGRSFGLIADKGIPYGCGGSRTRAKRDDIPYFNRKGERLLS